MNLEQSKWKKTKEEINFIIPVKFNIVKDVIVISFIWKTIIEW